MIKPAPGYILAEDIEDGDVTGSGLVIPESAKDKPIKARVIAIGDNIVAKERNISSPVNVKQVIYHHKWATQEFEDGGKKLIFLKFEDILGWESS